MKEVYVQAGLLDAGVIHASIAPGLSGRLIGVSAFGDGRPAIVLLDDSASQADLDALAEYSATGIMPLEQQPLPSKPLTTPPEAPSKKSRGIFPPKFRG